MQRYKLIVITNPVAVCGDNDDRSRDVVGTSRTVDERTSCSAGHRHDPPSCLRGYMSVYDCEAADVRQIIEELRSRAGSQSTISCETQLPRHGAYFRPKMNLAGDTIQENRTPDRIAAGVTTNQRAARNCSTLSDFDSGRLEEWAGRVAGPTLLEEQFGIPRSTLHWWQRHNDVIALRKGARKHVFPLAQFIDGRPVPGIRQVLALVPNHRLAWHWLIQPSPFLEGDIPIDRLRQDLIDEVVSAAQRFSST